MCSTTLNTTFISYNCKSIKRSVQSVRDLCGTADIILLQETWLLPHDLDFVCKINSDFGCVAKSSVDTSLGILKGRPYGGLAILWNKARFPLVSQVECNSDRIMAIKISVGSGYMLVVNVYMPVDKPDNLTEFTDCLAQVSAIIEESEVQVAYVLGDFNAHPSTFSFGVELERFCSDLLWECADINLLGGSADTFTFQSEAHGCRRWLDHCLTTKAAWDTIVSASVIYDVAWSDHYPLRIVCDIAGVAGGTATFGSCDALKNIRWGDREETQKHGYSKYCYENFNFNYSDNFNSICDCDTILVCLHFNDYFK